jgi:hypothetical protein
MWKNTLKKKNQYSIMNTLKCTVTLVHATIIVYTHTSQMKKTISNQCSQNYKNHAHKKVQKTHKNTKLEFQITKSEL